ncbi:hypothetical protein HNQ54_001376 [Anaerocolumna cellulosilytica]|nr:hypothetical protein [Anaerocolumna cellulosilytica]
MERSDLRAGRTYTENGEVEELEGTDFYRIGKEAVYEI